ncbi:APC family permease [Actinomadura macrotermitis]|uniref:Putrescine importer PuuP n=1 Tax=Actinomadura macrotermitis TaxID=2585200 RepID=A0A7K0C4W0_9ACTN|nr:APC family permease [Actinomadura macrotermitis]MQY08396.1 Putrescine importer PuuP [Actinomadura macrotermitis]
MSVLPPPERPAPARPDRLKPDSVGVIGVVFMALATAAPVTAMAGNMPYVIGGDGIGAPAGFLLVTLVLTVFTIGYVAMARYITAAGAFYGYVSYGLGRVAGMASGLLAVLAYMVFEASIVGIFAYFAKTAVAAQLGWDGPWEAYALGMLAVTAVLSYFDIDIAAKILGVFLVGEVSILLILAGSVLVHGGGPDGLAVKSLDPVEAFSGPSAGIGLFFCFWSWIGFESTAMYGEESRNPKRVIPRATLFAVIGLGTLYTFVTWMTISGNGFAESVRTAGSPEPLRLFTGPLDHYVGHWSVSVFEWLMCTSAFACGMAFHQCASRYLYAIGREGFIHRALGRTHPRHGSPFVASFAQTVIATAIVLAFAVSGKDPYTDLYGLMAILGTLALLIVQTLCSFAVIAYFRRRPPQERPWFATLAAPLLGGLGMLTAIWLLVDNLSFAAGAASKSLVFTLIPWIVGGVFAAGVAFALYMRARHPHRYEVMGRMILEDAQEREPVQAAVES